jgi:hypothetical protein
MKSNIKVVASGKEYPELTLDQIKLLVKLQNDGKTEAEALELIHNG